jgi:integrase
MEKPKTRAGERTLAMSPNAMASLERHLERIGKETTAWLFPDPESGNPIHPSRFTYRWNRCRAAIGRPELHFHDLRASGLTWAAIAGATHAELMHRGGHANVESVMIYQRAAEERDRELAQLLDYTPSEPEPQPPNLTVVSG